MGAVRISSKNQLIIPKEFRKKLNIKPGDELLVEEVDGIVVLIPRSKSFTNFQGLGKEAYKKEPPGTNRKTKKY